MMAPRKPKTKADGEPVPVVDATLGGKPNGVRGVNWDVAVKLITALTPIILAILTYLTFLNGQQASRAADSAGKAQVIAQETRVASAVTDTALLVQSAINAHKIDSTADKVDSVHVIVNSQKTELERINKALREQLLRAGIKPKEAQRGNDALPSSP